MANLKGQNFRVLRASGTNPLKFDVIGMATNCTITLTNNTEDANTKDDYDLSGKPVVTTKSWSISVDSLNVVDSAAMLDTMSAMEPILLLWDETDTTNNQDMVKNTFAKMGDAYLNDLTLTFNDRENSAKNLQFTGTGSIKPLLTGLSTEEIAMGSYTKGQNVRLLLSSDNTTAPAKVIAAAKQLSLHCSLSLEDSTTKDTAGDWINQDPTSLSYDISTSALVRSGESITSQVPAMSLKDIEDIYVAGTPVLWEIANVGGANNRTKVSTIVSGLAVLTQLTMNGPNRQDATYEARLNGYGAFEVASE